MSLMPDVSVMAGIWWPIWPRRGRLRAVFLRQTVGEADSSSAAAKGRMIVLAWSFPSIVI